MARQFLSALVILLAMVAPARATIQYMSSFDLLDTETTPDLLDLTTTVGNGAVDDDIFANNIAPRTATNGGAPNSSFSGYLNVTSGEQAYWSKPADRTFSSTDVSAHVAIYLPTLPTGSRQIAWFIQDVDGGIGCIYTINAASGNASTVAASYYNSGSPIAMGTSRNKLRVNQCNGYPRISCYANSDCPSGVTCGSQKYWGELTMRQRRSGNQVTCDLAIHGQPQWESTWHTAAAAMVSDVRVGTVFSLDTASLTLWADDLVVATNEDAGYGWVGFLTPNADGSQNEWTKMSCGDGAAFWECVDAYASGGQPSTADWPALRAQTSPRTFNVGLTNPPSWADGNTTVTAAAWSFVARTSASSSGTWDIRGSLRTASGTARGEVTGSITHPATDVLQRLSGVDPSSWTEAGLQGAQFRLGVDTETVGSGSIRAKAVGVMYYGQQSSSALLVPTLSDHNEGTDDTKKTLYLIGDSLLLGTAGVTCTNDPTRSCSQDTYCSWNDFSYPENYQDKPTGGCTTNAQCQTCVGQRQRSGDGAGFACTADGECPVSGTCNTTTEVCDANSAVPCLTDGDCALGGDCDTAATCNDACPGTDANGAPATCPGGIGASWASGLAAQVAVDTVVSCPLGNERTWEMEANRWTSIVAGQHATCGTLKGTGSCTCSIAADCDSGAGGTCTAGLCTAGTAATCTSNSSCETATCQFPLPDYVVIMEGANDLREFSPQAPECSEPAGYDIQSQVLAGGQITNAGWGAQFSVCRRNCTTEQLALSCVADSDCSSISSSSRCIGQTLADETSGQGYACLRNISAWGISCTMNNHAEDHDDDGTLSLLYGCNTDSDCNGGTCSINDSSARTLGWCSCTSSGQCGTGFQCVGSRCRKTCTTDANCTSGATRTGSCYDAGGGVKVCKGRCTCPCDAISCSTDADCSVGSVLTYNGEKTWVPGGICSGGKCSQCGRDTCAALSPGPTARTQEFVSASNYVARMDRLRAYLAALPDPGADGRPILIVVEHPIYSASDDGCRNTGVLFRDPGGGLRTATTRLLEHGHHVVTGTRAAWEPLLWPATVWDREGPPPTLIHPNTVSAGVTWDLVHFVTRSGPIIADLIADYLNTLGACTTAANVPQRYCYNPTNTTWGDACLDIFDCTSGVESCTPRPCTGASDCPDAGDSCRAE